MIQESKSLINDLNFLLSIFQLLKVGFKLLFQITKANLLYLWWKPFSYFWWLLEASKRFPFPLTNKLIQLRSQDQHKRNFHNNWLQMIRKSRIRKLMQMQCLKSLKIPPLSRKSKATIQRLKLTLLIMRMIPSMMNPEINLLKMLKLKNK